MKDIPHIELIPTPSDRSAHDEDHHDHDHDYSDSTEPETPDRSPKVIRKLLWVCGVGLLFMIIEVVGGLMADSLAILSDAVHLLSDLSGFVISIVSLVIAQYAPTNTYTFGYQRAGVIGAMINIVTIWILTGFLLYEAIWRLVNLDKVEVDGNVMFITACLGLVCNLIMAKVLHSHDGHGHHGHSHGHKHSHEGHACHGHEHDHHGHKHEERKKEHRHSPRKLKDGDKDGMEVINYLK